MFDSSSVGLLEDHKEANVMGNFKLKASFAIFLLVWGFPLSQEQGKKVLT